MHNKNRHISLRLVHSDCVHSTCRGLNSLPFKSTCEFVAISYRYFGTGHDCRPYLYRPATRWFFRWNSPSGARFVNTVTINIKSKKKCSTDRYVYIKKEYNIIYTRKRPGLIFLRHKIIGIPKYVCVSCHFYRLRH